MSEATDVTTAQTDEVLTEVEGDVEGDVEVDNDENESEDEVVDATRVPARQVHLPQGIVTPIQLLNKLIQKKKAPADTAPQRMYGYVKSPGKEDPFPVKHYDASGKTYDEPQTNEGGLVYTRPGIELKAGMAWWGRAGQRAETKAKKKAEKAAEKKKKEEEKAAASAADEDTEDVELEEGEEFVEAEAE